jgi:Uma2 family endonuclease
MAAHPLAGRRVTLPEYHSLVRDGVLREDDEVQLLRGTIVEMTPQGVTHARAIRALTRHFVVAVGSAADVLVQLPLTLPDDSEPEPDLALVGPDEAARRDGHPRSALLVIEVAGDSLRQDREVTREIYAAAGIPEYWIVDLEGRCVEVHREPAPRTGRYATVFRVSEIDTVAPVAFPDAALSVAALFG